MVAHAFPHTQFAITQGSFLAPNVACYEVLQEQSAFLAGVLAASITRSGVVAHMSGEKVRPGLKGRAAFADGVHYHNPAVKLVTLFCGNQHDPELAYRVVTAQANAGADVLFAMIDGGRDGAIRACRERGLLQIGNVMDWTAVDPAMFIASAIADSGHCIGLAVADFLAHRLGLGHKRTIGLENPRCVRLAMAPQVQDVARHNVHIAQNLLLAGTLEAAGEYKGPEMVM
jgi:basic membrane protein A